MSATCGAPTGNGSCRRPAGWGTANRGQGPCKAHIPDEAATASVDGEPVEGDAVVIQGVACCRGHFNHPGQRYCLVCGAALRAGPRTPVLGPRPALGALVGDAGATHVLDRDHLVVDQRAKVAAPAIVLPRSGPGALRLQLRLQGWEVVVAHLRSPETVSIRVPGGRQMVLARGESAVLEPGWALAVGERSLLFVSPFEVRPTRRRADAARPQ